jgi:hypothetical protein
MLTGDRGQATPDNRALHHTSDSSYRAKQGISSIPKKLFARERSSDEPGRASRK